ncbi:MAG: hypothetical protein IKJ84_01520 [Oscillospiraceae bacterium]|nr:hypothetical protein [Oscillospiraceae bacterium]
MSIRMKEIYDFLDEHPLNRYQRGFESFMELLYDAYTQQNPMITEKTYEKLRTIKDLLCELPPDLVEKVNNTLYDLNLEQEVLAFSHGIAVGLHMMTEVNAFMQNE